MKTFVNLSFGLLLSAYIGCVAFGQAPAATLPQTPAGKAFADPNLDKYNNAVYDFNQATQAYNTAKNSGQPLDPANAKIATTITELKEASLLPAYQKDTVKQATLHNLLGYLYLTQGDTANAVTELQTTVQDDPGNLDAHNNLGNALRGSSPPDYAGAAVQYEYILAHPAAPGGHSSLDINKVKFNLATVEGQAGRMDESLALFQELTASDPSAAVYKNYGFFLQKAGKSAEAADALQKAAQISPKDAEVWFNSGQLYAKSGNQNQAIAALTKAVGPDVDPKLDVKNEYDAYFALGEAYAANSDPNQAMKEFLTASQLQPLNAVPLYNMGVLQEQAGLRADAQTSYRSALKLDPNNAQIQMALGLLLADSGNSAEAAALLAQVAPKLPQNSKAAPVYARLGDVYARQHNYSDSNKARLQALTLNSADTDTRLALGDSYMAQKQYVSALVQYDIAAAAKPNDAAIQNQRGVAYKNLKQYPKALAAFKRALALSPRNAQVQNNIGVLDELLGRRAEAIVAYKKALALNPGLTVARMNLVRFSHP